MKRALIALLLGLTTLLFAANVMAGPEANNYACISLHVGPWLSKNICENAPVLTNDTMVTEVSGCAGDYYMLWVLVCNASDSLGVAGLEYGIDYDGVENEGIDINGWTSCTDLEFPNDNWPLPGTGNLQTWDYTTNCQNTPSEHANPFSVIAIAGAFDVTAYGSDLFSITPRPVSGYAKIGSCFGAETDITNMQPSHLGVAAFCLPGQSYNPCAAPTPVEPSTWGRIKQQY